MAYSYVADMMQQKKDSEVAKTELVKNYGYQGQVSPVQEEDQKQFQNQGGGYNYNAANLARQLEAANAKKKEIEEQQRKAEEQRQKQLQWDKAEQEYNDKNRALADKRLAAQEKATQAQLSKSMNNTGYTYSPYGYDPTTGAPLNKSGYIYTPVKQPQSQMIVSQPDLNQQRKVYDINNYRTDKYYQDSIAQQKKDTAATYVFSQPQEQQPLKAEAERQPASGYLTPQQLALLSRVSSGGAGYNVAAELLPQSPVTKRQTINGAKYLNPQQLAELNMKQVKEAQGSDLMKAAQGQTLQNFQYVKDSGEQQQGAVKNFGRNTQQSTATNISGEPNLPYGTKVVPSQDGKSTVTLLPYKKGGYFIEDLQDLGMQPKDNWRKDQFGYDTQGQPYFEGYYYNRQDGKYYPVNYDKARYAIEKGADSAYDTWAYKGYNPDMAEYYKMFGTYYGYTPTWRTTAFANASGAGKSGGGYSWNTGSGSGNSGNNTNSEQENQRRYYNDFVIWRP